MVSRLLSVVSRQLPLGLERPSPQAGDIALSPLGEKVDRDGAFISRRGPGEGVADPETTDSGPRPKDEGRTTSEC